MPARCPVASESKELGEEVRLLLHGRKNRTYKIYFAIQHATASTGLVRIFHVRHWARQGLSPYELQDLVEKFADDQGEEQI